MRVVDVNKFVSILKAAKELSADYVYIEDGKCIVLDPSSSAAAFGEIEVEGSGKYFIDVPDKAMRKIVSANSIEIDSDSVIFKGADFRLKVGLLNESDEPNNIFELYDRFTNKSENIDCEHSKFISAVNDVISIGSDSGCIRFSGDKIVMSPKSKDIEFEVSFSASSNDDSERFVVLNFKDLLRPIVKVMSGSLKLWILDENHPFVVSDGKIAGLVAPMVEEI